MSLTIKFVLLRTFLFALVFGTIQTASLFAQQDFRVYIFVAEECPISIAMAAPLRSVVEKYHDRAEFTAVFPNRKSDEISIRAFLGRYELQGFQPVLDPNQEVSRKLGATVTPEVVVTDVADRILYRGRISDAYSAPGRVRHGKAKNELEMVLRTLTSGGKVVQPWPEAIGCFITFFGVAQ